MSSKRDVGDLDELSWLTSSYSGSGGGNCVEVAKIDDVVCVRDTKDRGGPVLSVPGGQWRAFLTRVVER